MFFYKIFLFILFFFLSNNLLSAPYVVLDKAKLICDYKSKKNHQEELFISRTIDNFSGIYEFKKNGKNSVKHINGTIIGKNLIIKGFHYSSKNNEYYNYSGKVELINNSLNETIYSSEYKDGIPIKEGNSKCRLRFDEYFLSYRDIQMAPSLSKTLDRSQNKIEGLEDEIEDLKSTLSSSDIKLTSLNEELDNLKNMKETNENDFQKLSKEKSNLESKIDQLILENEELKSSDYQKEIINLKLIIDDKEKEIVNLNEQLVSDDETKTSFNDQIKEKDLLISSLTEELSSLKNSESNELVSLATTIANMQVELNDNKIKLEQLLEENTSLKNKVNTNDTTNAAFIDKISSLQSENNSLKNDLNVINEQNESLNSQLDNIKKMLNIDSGANNISDNKSSSVDNNLSYEVIFKNQWQGDLNMCSTNSHTIYDKNLGNIFVLGGEKQISPNRMEVDFVENNNTEILIKTIIYSNDFFTDLNNGKEFIVAKIKEVVRVVDENTIEIVEKEIKQIDTEKFMNNSSDKIFNTINESGKKYSCGSNPDYDQSKTISQKIDNNTVAQKSSQNESTSKYEYRDDQRACTPDEYKSLEFFFNVGGYNVPFSEKDCVVWEKPNLFFMYSYQEQLSGWNVNFRVNPSRFQISYGSIPEFCVLQRNNFELYNKADCTFVDY